MYRAYIYYKLYKRLHSNTSAIYIIFRRDKLNRSEVKDTRKTFGVPLASITAREGDACPYIIRACTAEVEKRGLRDVGVYRVSAAKSDILQLKEFFDSNHPDLSRKIEKADVHVVTGVLKKFLMELPEPLIHAPFSDKLAEAITHFQVNLLKHT